VQTIQELVVMRCVIWLDVKTLHQFHVETTGTNRTRYGIGKKAQDPEKDADQDGLTKNLRY
jgi:hypothetical protein